LGPNSQYVQNQELASILLNYHIVNYVQNQELATILLNYHIVNFGPKIKKGVCNGLHWARGQQPLTQTPKQEGVVDLKLKNMMA